MDDLINESDFIFYNGEDGKVHAQVILGDETVWITQKTMGEVFDVTIPTINEHLQNIFKSGELDEAAVIRKIRTTAADNKNYLINFYNLEVIISVGFRVNSHKATRFRQWANRILKEYLIKGFVMDDERLKQGNNLFNKDFFKELIERVREIRASEKMFYEKLRSLFALSPDYDKKDPRMIDFFSKIQNKIEFAIVDKTSPEILVSRADSSKPNMGLQTFKNAKREDGEVQKSDVSVAKNFLTEPELRSLNLFVTMFLDYAESILERGDKVMKMIDLEKSLDRFIEFNERKVLKNAGKVSSKFAKQYVEKEYAKFKQIPRGTQAFNSALNLIKSGSIPSESNEVKEQLSDFNKKLVTALNYNPKDAPPTEKKKRGPKPKTKECPRCGKTLPQNAKFCDGTIELKDDWVNCGYVF